MTKQSRVIALQYIKTRKKVKGAKWGEGSQAGPGTVQFYGGEDLEQQQNLTGREHLKVIQSNGFVSQLRKCDLNCPVNTQIQKVPRQKRDV